MCFGTDTIPATHRTGVWAMLTAWILLFQALDEKGKQAQRGAAKTTRRKGGIRAEDLEEGATPGERYTRAPALPLGVCTL